MESGFRDDEGVRRMLADPAQGPHLVAQATREAQQAAEKALESATDFLPRVANGMRRSSELLSRGEVAEGMRLFSDVCDGLGWFFGLVGGLDWLLPPGPDRPSWEQETAHFRESLAGMQKAMEAEDWVAVSDTLTYEWAPKVGAWCGQLPQTLTALKSIQNPTQA